jgi:hypothetical protein
VEAVERYEIGGRFTRESYKRDKQEALRHLRHAVEQGEKDQWFNALRSVGRATAAAASALQAIINREEWS